jgi:hypothetical protein
MRITNRCRGKRAASTPISPDDALTESAKQVVRASVNAEFKPDPLFTADLSRLLSTASSIVKRHGPLIEDAIAAELERAKLIVKRHVPVPITRAALAMVDSRDYPEFAEQEFSFDENDIVDHADIDILAIDEANGWAAAVSVKRGGGLTEPRKRKSNERCLRALELILASRLRQQGYHRIETAVVALLDYLGQSGFSEDLTITGDAIDGFFDLPVVAAIDRMTASLSRAFDHETRRLLEPILLSLKSETPQDDGLDVADKLSPRGRRGRRRVSPAGEVLNPLPRVSAPSIVRRQSAVI